MARSRSRSPPRRSPRRSRSPPPRNRDDRDRSPPRRGGSKWDDDDRDHRRRDFDRDRERQRDRDGDRERERDRGERDRQQPARPPPPPRNEEREERRPPPPRQQRRREKEEDYGSYEWGKQEDRDREKAEKEEAENAPKAVANFGQSGLLAEEVNKVNGVALKFTEPADARVPKNRYRLYVFKGNSEDPIDTIYIHRKSCFLLGRAREIADIVAEHPSCSSQHAVIQYRQIEIQVENADGMLETRRVTRPYLMDLESTNGTFLRINGKFEKIEPARYYELKVEDVFKLGNSSREYVVLRDDAV